MNEDCRPLQANVNGKSVYATVPVRTLLSDFLRHDLGLTGTHVGCEHGACGACTIILDGLAVRSCLMLAVQINECTVITVEGLSSDGNLNDLQESFHENHALQCGFCTPGILCSIQAALAAGTSPEIMMSEVLDGHICRCTGYAGIRAAIRAICLREKTVK